MDQVKHCNVACTKTSETTQRQDYPYNTSTPITNFGNASPLIDYSKNPPAKYSWDRIRIQQQGKEAANLGWVSSDNEV